MHSDWTNNVKMPNKSKFWKLNLKNNQKNIKNKTTQKLKLNILCIVPHFRFDGENWEQKRLFWI